MERQKEPELLRAAQRGDAAARDQLYREYFADNKQVRSLLNRSVPTPEDREDILHDAYISLIRSAAEFRGDSRLMTFVYRVVQLAILQKMRSDRSRRLDKMVRLSMEVDGEDRERQLAVTDYQFEEVEAGAVADRLYSMLPESLRNTFRLRVSDELSYEEIARITNSPVNTVATRIFKARALLAKLFGAPGEEDHRSRSAKKAPGRSN